MNISVRAPRGYDDCMAMHNIRQESAVIDKIDPLSTCENIPSFDRLVQDTKNTDKFLLLMLDGEPIGYAELSWWHEADGTWVYMHNDWVYPLYRSPDILEWFFGYIRWWLSTVAANAGHIDHAVFAANASETEPDRAQLLVAGGYEKMWEMVEMEFSNFSHLTPAPLPEKIEIRSPLPGEYRAMWEANEAIYEGTWGNIPSTESAYHEFVARSLQDPSLCRVAIDDKQIAGFALTYMENGRGVVSEVSTMRTHQKRGVARALMSRVLVELNSVGANVVRLHTDSAGRMGGRPLYERLGFESLKLHGRYRKTMS